MLCCSEQALDSWLVFYTAKYVRVYRSHLGFSRFLFILGVMSYVIVYEMLYLGRHLIHMDELGNVMATIQRPTLNGCSPFAKSCRLNLRGKADLPYCVNSSSVMRDKRRCEYLDELEINKLAGCVPPVGRLFVPTLVEEYQAKRLYSQFDDTTSPERMNVYYDTHGTQQWHAWKNAIRKKKGPTRRVPTQDYYIADIERYTILLDHQAIGASEDECFEDTDMEGYFINKYGQEEKIPWIQSKDMGLQDDNQSLASDMLTEYGPVLVKRGVVMSVGTLLSIAGFTLDTMLDKEIHDSRGSRGKRHIHTYRSCGFDIGVHISYTNKEDEWTGLMVTPWSRMKPWYTISVQKGDPHCIKEWLTSSNSPWRIEPNQTRTEANVHGIRISVYQSGDIATWSTTQMLIVALSSMGLLSFSLYALDFLAEYLTVWFEMIKYDTHWGNHFVP